MISSTVAVTRDPSQEKDERSFATTIVSGGRLPERQASDVTIGTGGGPVFASGAASDSQNSNYNATGSFQQ